MNQRGCEAIGIDLGTTFSSLAYLDEQMMPRVIQDSSGKSVIPSVVFFDDDDVIVGEIALEQAATRADRVVQFVKVHMGEEWRREFDGQVHTPESISSIILAHLLREAEPQIGEIGKAVITVPAYFTDKRRRATAQAGEIVGLDVLGTLNEPMSAALAYGLHKEEREQTVVVYDLGGGTFDVTIVRITPNELAEIATLGNRQLGGKDWDDALLQHVADEFQQRFGRDPRASLDTLQHLIVECERAKRRLSQLKKASVKLQAFGQEHVTEVTREQFQQLTAPLLETTKITTELTLEDAGLDWKDIDRVLLVGGSTHMPMVRDMLADVSGRRPDTGINPVLAVALGAAQYAYLLESGTAPEAVHLQRTKEPASDGKSKKTSVETRPISLPSVRFVTAHGVGVKARVKGERRNVVLIRKNSPVPCVVRKTFTTYSDAKGRVQRRIPIVVTQGDTPRLDLAEVIGEGWITGIPDGEKSGKPVEVTMQFDEHARLNVHAVYVPTEGSLNLELVVPGGLTEEAVQEYRKLLETSGLIESPRPETPIVDPIELFEASASDDDDLDDDIPLLEPVN